MPPTETVTLKLPSGEMVDALVPSGMSDADIHGLMQQKHPEFFGQSLRGAGAEEGSGELYSSPSGPNPQGMANQALAKSGIQVAPPRSGVKLPASGIPARVLAAMGAAASNLPNPVPGQGVGTYDPATGKVSGLTPHPLQELSGIPASIKAMIAGPAQRIGSGDVAGGMGEASVNYPAAGVMMKSAADVANLAAPSKTRASANFKDIMSRESTTPVDTTISEMAAQNVKTLASRGGQMPKVVKDFMRRIGDQEQGPLTYREAQDFISKATGKTATDIRGNPLKGKDLAEMVKFRNALRADITSAISPTPMEELVQRSQGQTTNTADQYVQANREYRAANQVRGAVGTAATMGTAFALEEYIRRKLFGH